MSFDAAQLGPASPMLTVFCGGVILLLLAAFLLVVQLAGR